MRGHDLDTLGLLAEGAPVLARPAGLWGELPDGTFIPFEGKGNDSSALASILQICLDRPGFLEAVRANARAYCEGRGSVGEMADRLSGFMARLSVAEN